MRRNFHHIFDKRGYCIYFITSAYHFFSSSTHFCIDFLAILSCIFFFLLFRYCFLILLFFVCLFQTYFDIDFYHTLFLIFFLRQCFVLIGTIHKACPHIRGERNLCGHPLWMTPSQANFYSLPLFSS